MWASELGHAIKPMRLLKHQNYLSEEEYPMDTLPPFAIGPHYIVFPSLSLPIHIIDHYPYHISSELLAFHSTLIHDT